MGKWARILECANILPWSVLCESVVPSAAQVLHSRYVEHGLVLGHQQRDAVASFSRYHQLCVKGLLLLEQLMLSHPKLQDSAEILVRKDHHHHEFVYFRIISHEASMLSRLDECARHHRNRASASTNRDLIKQRNLLHWSTFLQTMNIFIIKGYNWVLMLAIGALLIPLWQHD